MPDENLSRVIDLCYQMLELADHGDKLRRDAGSGVVYAALRDAAYKVRKLAKKEQARQGMEPGLETDQRERGSL
ncbi:MAG: hypothetical protein KKA60_12535 [Proteobacteria bacterium]|nr:hypothetical protein [Pseudomonadota bacterium]